MLGGGKRVVVVAGCLSGEQNTAVRLVADWPNKLS